MRAENRCPRCGNHKNEDYELCYNCHLEDNEDEDKICECGNYKNPDFKTCWECKQGDS